MNQTTVQVGAMRKSLLLNRTRIKRRRMFQKFLHCQTVVKESEEVIIFVTNLSLVNLLLAIVSDV